MAQKKKMNEIEKYVNEMMLLLKNGRKEKIESVGLTTNWLFYESEEYEEREGYEIITTEGSKFFLNIPKTASGNSNLLKYAEKYGSVPKKGQEISIDCSGEYDKILL